MFKNICVYENCNREKWENDKKFCIFHSKKVDEKEEEFYREFERQYPKGFLNQKNEIVLTGFVFPYFNFFRNCHIDKMISFNGSSFLRETTFENTVFLKKVGFINVKFENEINFKKAYFCNDVSFDSAEFYKFTDFRYAKFFEKVYFSDAYFEKNINFNLAIFIGQVFFTKSEICSRAEFTLTEFHNLLKLNEVYGNGDLNFISCLFRSLVDLRVKKCKSINLIDSRNENIIEFEPTKAEKVGINKIHLIKLKNLGHIYIDWYKNDIQKLINNSTNSFEIKANQYRMLKENYRKLGWYEQEDKAYYEFKKNKIRAEYKQDENFLNKIKFELKKIFYEKMGGYGTKPFSIFISMIITVLAFWIIYLLFFQGKSPFFHSVITFLTIGYGSDYININSFCAKLLSGFEGFAGLFLMSYFTVAFVRKVLR